MKPLLFDLTTNFDNDMDALDWAEGFVFSECEPIRDVYPRCKREVGIVQSSIKVWHDFGADYYFFEDLTV